MKDKSGHKVKIGDKVELWRGCVGVVVCSIDDAEYTNNYSKADWEYLEEGVLVLSDKAGLVHVTSVNEDFRVLKS